MEVQSRYTCPRCHYKTNHRTAYVNHLNRVSPCATTHSKQTQSEILASIKKPFQCACCGKTFAHSSSFYRHKKEHSNEPEPTVDNVDNANEAPTPPAIKKGVVYLVTSSIMTWLKLGYWKGSYHSLYDRYKTCYGRDLEVYLFPCHDCRLLEQIAKIIFRPHNLSFELFGRTQEQLNHYTRILSYLCVLSETDLQTAFMSCCEDPETFLKGVPESIVPAFTHVTPFLIIK